MENTFKNLVDSAVRSSSGESNWFKIRKGVQMDFFLEATAKTSSPTLAVTVVESPDKAIEYLLHTFTQLTDVGQEKKAGEWPGLWVKVKWVFGGTGDITFRVVSVVKEAL